MFGISGIEFLVILAVAVVFLGPTHAAQAVNGIRKAVIGLRGYSAKMREQMAANRAKMTLEDLGISPEDIAALRELRASTGSLDPRAYVRKAVSEEMDAWLGMAPVPITRATNLPHSGKGVSMAQARAEFAAEKAAKEAAAKAAQGQQAAKKAADDGVKAAKEAAEKGVQAAKAAVPDIAPSDAQEAQAGTVESSSDSAQGQTAQGESDALGKE